MGKVFKALHKAAPVLEDDYAVIPPEDDPGADPTGTAAQETAPVAELFRPAGGQPEAAAPQRPAVAPAEEPWALPPTEEEQNGRGWDELLLAASGTASPVAEEFRRLRTSILHPANGAKPAKTILVVSAAPEEGKSFVCANLGITMAQGVEQHALLIDCDLRRPSLAGLFGLGNEKGLTNYLRDGIDLGGLLRKTGIRKLSILPSGPPPANPAELLDSTRLRTMVEEVANRYPDRYVIFDSPPLFSAAETAILAKHVDGIVLVIREGKARREDIALLVETVGKEKIIGVVYNAQELNLLESKMAGYYGDYYQSYGAKKPTDRKSRAK